MAFTLAAARIADYSQSDYIPISDGNVVVWESHGYLRHTTNLTEFARMVEETKGLSDSFPQSHMRKLLEIDVDHISTMLSAITIHHRMARSLDFLGSALKVVAGTPDAADLEHIRITEAQLVESNNRQVVINTKAQNQINALTNTVNELLKAAKNSQIDTGHLYENLLARNRILTTEIQNVMLSITLAKLNIINPAILDNTDVKNMFTDQLTEITTTNVLEVASVKVFQSDSIIYFIIKYPIAKLLCRKVVIYPVVHNGTTLQLADNTLAECDDGIWSVTNCSTATTATFCKLSKESTCAKGLHTGGVAHCETQPSNLEAITLIDDGIIVVNDLPARVSVDDGPEVKVAGTFLLTFTNSAYVNGTKYLNIKNVQNRVPGVAASSLLNVTSHNPVLSLKFLQHLSEKNLNFIKSIEDEFSSSSFLVLAVCLGLGVCAMASSAVLLNQLRVKRRNERQIAAMLHRMSIAEDGQSSVWGSS